MRLRILLPSVPESSQRPLLVNALLSFAQCRIAKVVNVRHVVPAIVSVHPRHSESPITSSHSQYEASNFEQGTAAYRANR
jgi:hypothetical protein